MHGRQRNERTACPQPNISFTGALMFNHKRRQMFVDRRVQGTLIVHAIFYWAFCLISMTLMLLCWRIVTGPARMFYTHFDDMWFHYGPAVIASTLLLPIVVIDIIRLSNRFAGPIARLRRSMQDLAAGEQVQPIHFRDDDFWGEIAENFNKVASRVKVAELAAAGAGPAQRAPAELELVGSSAE